MILQRSGVIVSAAALVFALPLIVLGYPRLAHDAIFHIPWATHFARVLWSGTLYPRWLPDMYEGLGSPAFFYYPPLSYYLAALFDFGPDRALAGAFQLRLAAPVALVLSGLACFVFLRRLAGREAAVIGAVAYAAMPYHLLDIYVRGDLAEFTAFIFLPLVLASLGYTVRRPLTGLLLTAVSFAALALCHPLMALLSSPLLAAYTLFLFVRCRSWRALGAAACGATLGVGLAAVFLVPALSMQRSVFYMDRFFATDFLFLSGKRPHSASVGFQYEIWAVFLVSAMALALAYACRRKIGRSRQLAFWSLCGLAYCVLMTKLAEPFWVHVKPAQVFQFPYRLEFAVAMTLTVCLTLWASRLSERYKRIVLACCVLMGVVSAAVPVATDYFHDDPARWARAAQCGGARLFLPAVAPDWRCGDRISPLGRSVSDRAWFADGRSVPVAHWKSRAIAVDVQSQTAQTLYIRQFAYPGWQAVLDDGRILMPVPTADGIVAFAVPAGRHRLSIMLGRQPPEVWGLRIFQAAFAVLLLLAILDIALRRKVPYALLRKIPWLAGAQPS